MSWSKYIENLGVLASFGAAAEDWGSIELHELIVHRDGPVLRLRFDVPFVPAKFPARWPIEANTTQITLAAWGIENLSVTGWGTSVRGLLSAGDDSDGRVLRFNGESCSVQTSYAFLRVEKVSGYVNDSMANRSANTDPQHQEAASPQVLRPGCLERYLS